MYLSCGCWPFFFILFTNMRSSFRIPDIPVASFWGSTPGGPSAISNWFSMSPTGSGEIAEELFIFLDARLLINDDLLLPAGTCGVSARLSVNICGTPLIPTHQPAPLSRQRQKSRKRGINAQNTYLALVAERMPVLTLDLDLLELMFL